MYALERVTAPAAHFLEDARVWDHLRLSLSGSPAAPDDEAQVAIYRDAAETHIDGAMGILGRAIITQTWRMKMDAFPADPTARIRIPLPPLQSVSSITYVDQNGSTQTLASSGYKVMAAGENPGSIALAYGQEWPSTREEPEAVTITFVCGFGDAASDVPAAVINAGLLLVAHWYDQRAAVHVSNGGTVDEMPLAVGALLAPYRFLSY